MSFRKAVGKHASCALGLAMGVHYAHIGDYAAVRRHFGEALRIRPDWDTARKNTDAISHIQ